MAVKGARTTLFFLLSMETFHFILTHVYAKNVITFILIKRDKNIMGKLPINNWTIITDVLR